MTKSLCRVLVAEDSPTARALLVAMLESDSSIRVVGEAASGEAAVRETIRLRPDVITMDVHMPGLDGLGATRAIMAQTPTPILIVSALVADDVRLSMEATRAGALLVLPKPVDPRGDEFERQRAQLVGMVKAMAGVKVVRRWSHGKTGAGGGPNGTSEDVPNDLSNDAVRDAVRESPRLVAIGASTGGPAALRDLLAALPASFPVPILVVQHIARGFVAGLAQWLDGETALDVRVARDGEAALPGTVYIAPDDRHLGVSGGHTVRVALSDAPPVGTFRPSASHLFESAGRALGRALVAVILTGMGDDGVSGLRVARGLGGEVVAQDEETSVIYGMPREAARAGVVDVVLPLPEIAPWLQRAARRPPRGRPHA